MTQEEVVAKQLEYYNAHDIEGFCSMYAEDIEMRILGETAPYIRSMGELRRAYAEKFKDPELKATVANRMVKGSFVIDHEQITGQGGHREAIVTYQVRDDSIAKVWIIR